MRASELTCAIGGMLSLSRVPCRAEQGSLARRVADAGRRGEDAAVGGTCPVPVPLFVPLE